MENGVDFAHFKYVHNTPLVPEFTRHDFAQPVSYVDFTIAFDDVPADEINSGVKRSTAASESPPRRAGE